MTSYLVSYKGITSELKNSLESLQLELNRLEKEGVLDVIIQKYTKCEKRFVNIMDSEKRFVFGGGTWNKT